MVEECCVLLHNIVMQDDVEDRWEWHLEPVKGYIVGGVYHLLA